MGFNFSKNSLIYVNFFLTFFKYLTTLYDTRFFFDYIADLGINKQYIEAIRSVQFIAQHIKDGKYNHL